MSTNTPLLPSPIKVVSFSKDNISAICCLGDFYEALGVGDLMKDGTADDISQYWMNKAVCEELEDIVFKNARKDRRYKHLRDKSLKTAVAMDWLNYSPVAVEYIPEDELWIFSHDDSVAALNAHRAWLREKERKEHE